jgi:hypothetical protein
VFKHRKCFCSRNIENAYAAKRHVTDIRTRLSELIDYATTTIGMNYFFIFHFKIVFIHGHTHMSLVVNGTNWCQHNS